ncbi:hypothetical protein [Pandoraea sputorum]|uniref:Uncharacterized protein n=1 Tax=Pandoraea sputorum TaxID=93222 RepID=A0A239SC06_9BURK|nr:hypothetical protein [Pandoraea sputorum]AJC16096.1 hypothetical protein NA29_08540 [Pandoraea sputorum]SNU82173.1 Uncharacterised protein [Pandoraea sputorum]VVE44863.1 hypothetical protein PSP20601_04341 [Pandoraea sputorum]
MISRAPPVEVQPITRLARWQVFEVDSGTHHFVGWVNEDMRGSVSSAIQEFDTQKGAGRTASGRIYQLAGPSSYDGDALYVWDQWRRLNHVESFQDVSTEYNFATDNH